MTLDDLLSRHAVIAGMTDTGKTTLAKAMFHGTKLRAVFVNTQEEDLGLPHFLEWDLETLRKTAKINFVPSVDRDKATVQIDRMVGDLMAVGKAINPTRAGKPWCVVFVDEAHEYSPKLGRPHDPLKTLAKRGKRYGITLVSISQRPADLSHTVLTQSATHIYYNMSNYERGYFQKYAVPYERFETHVAKPFHFVMIRKGQVDEYGPISPDYST